MTRAAIELTGQVFGQLTVLRRAEKTSKGHLRWVCLCACGRECEVIGRTLRSGETKGCPTCRLLPAGEAARNSLYATYRAQAQARNYVFELTIGQFSALTRQPCIYCGIEPLQTHKPSDCATAYIYNGIDRKDNTAGYEGSNCVPCCGVCNKMKGALSHDEFLSHIQRIIAHRLSR
jgi:hypothetical protein